MTPLLCGRAVKRHVLKRNHAQNAVAVTISVDPVALAEGQPQPRCATIVGITGCSVREIPPFGKGPDVDRSSIAARNLRAEQFYGQGIDRLFPPGTFEKRGTPWGMAGGSKHHGPYDRDIVREALRRPPELTEVDPVDLIATQPHILRPHVNYYLSDEYQRTGRTSEPGDNVGNRFPVVYRRDPSPINPDAGHQNLILSGHHRAAAALVKGEPLRAIYLEGPWGSSH